AGIKTADGHVRRARVNELAIAEIDAGVAHSAGGGDEIQRVAAAYAFGTPPRAGQATDVELLVGVARQTDAGLGERRLHEPRAVDAVLGLAAPQVAGSQQRLGVVDDRLDAGGGALLLIGVGARSADGLGEFV